MLLPAPRLPVVLALCWLVACASAEPEREIKAAHDDGVDVLARVQGVAIHTAEVRALAQERGLSMRTALTLVEDAYLLEIHAKALGFAETHASRMERERASVALLLQRAVTEAAPGDVAAQRKIYAELIDALRDRASVFVHEDTVRDAFADPALFGSAGRR